MAKTSVCKGRLVELNGLSFTLSSSGDDCTVLTDEALDQLETQLKEQAANPDSELSKNIKIAFLQAAEKLYKPFSIETGKLLSKTSEPVTGTAQLELLRRELKPYMVFQSAVVRGEGK